MLHSRYLKSPFSRLKYWLFGSPLRNTAQKREKLGVWGGLAVLGSDALSSIAYATEEIFLALAILGPQAFDLSIPIACAIVVTLLIVIFSYRQTVAVHPNGGGAYMVAKHHLGRLPALVAAGSLLMDYVLTVAVSVSAGVRALTSLFPSLYHASVNIAIGAVIFLCWINLRGVRESARVFALPLYGFVMIISSLCLYGIYDGIYGFTDISSPHLSVTPSQWSSMMDVSGLLIILRAFSGGCTAMTGIEAIANAGPLLKEPHVKNAQRIYSLLAILLAFMFLSLTILAQQYGISPRPQESLLSQLARRLWGEGLFYTTLQLFTAIVLFLAANTAFAAYPRLCAILARDGWLPKQLSSVGDRLVFHKGIFLLTLLVIVFLIIFRANVHHLIPLYAIGVLIAFTLSQFGMMRYWLAHLNRVPLKNDSVLLKNDKDKHHQIPLKIPSKLFTKRSIRFRAFLSGFGALTTGLVLIIFFESKFVQGAYLSLVVIPLLCWMCLKIQHHYQQVEPQLMVSEEQIRRPRAFSDFSKRQALVPISRIHLGSLEALAFARELTNHVIAVLVELDYDQTLATKNFIEKLNWNIQVLILQSPYRSIINPLLEYLSTFEKDTLIIFPEIVPKKWWQKFLHNETVLELIKALGWYPPLVGQTRIIITVPYYLQK
jgi:amino acid transporter